MIEALSIYFTYGEALYGAAKDTGKYDEMRAELNALRELFAGMPELFEFIKTPTIDAVEKKRILTEIFEKKISVEILNFLFVLIDKQRVFHFEGIVKAFEEILDDREGVSKGVVYSVVDLTDEEIDRLTEQTAKLLQKKIKLTNKIDKSLIGGVRIYVDGQLIDGSVKKRLEDLKEVLI